MLGLVGLCDTKEVEVVRDEDAEGVLTGVM